MLEIELFENDGYVGTTDMPETEVVVGNVYEGMLIVAVEPATNGSDFNVTIEYVD